MNMFDAVMIVECEVESTNEKYFEAWQFLHDSGVAYQLQGWFGRTAQRLIEEGLIRA